MKIKLILRLVAYKAEEERRVPPGATVKDLVEAYLSTCPPQARRMLVDKQGVFRGVVLLNKSRADWQQTLQDGDEVIFLSIISGG